MKYRYVEGVINSKPRFLIFVGVLLTALAMTIANITRVDAQAPEVVVSQGECDPTIITANNTSNISNMFLVVSVDGVTAEYENIPAMGSVGIEVGPYTTNTNVQWRVFGGGERDYDIPEWNGYGGPSFGADIANYAANNGGYSWVLSGPQDPNPFTTWNDLEVDACKSGEIIKPQAGDVVSGTLELEAKYYDGDDSDSDYVLWAVRTGASCAAGQGTNVAGNVGQFSPPNATSFEWDTMNFSSTIDVSSWPEGTYCFVFNPNNNSDNVREVVAFQINQVSKDECKKDGWQLWAQPEFKSQGDCVSYTVSETQATLNPDNGRGRGSRR